MRAVRIALVLATIAAGSFLSAGGDTPKSTVAADEQLLKQASLGTDAPTLLALFKSRTLDEQEVAQLTALCKDLGATLFRDRERASAKLIARGPAVIEVLRAALAASADLEVTKRLETCIQKIQEKEHAPNVLSAAARLLRERKPAGAVEPLLGYIPFASSEEIADEIRTTLTALALHDGKVEPALVKALADKTPLIRASAGEVLTRAKVADTKTSVRKLLADPDASVKLRVATALLETADKEAIPVLIQVLPEVSQGQAWQAEDLLYRIADGHTPPQTTLGADKAAREKCRDAWSKWWQAHSAKVDLTKLQQGPALLGYTTLVLLDQGKVIEVTKDQKVRWEVSNLVFPLDVQVLPGDRVLVAEYHAMRVTERDLTGEVRWEMRVTGPLVAQRLANGNTFIATDSQLIEVDPAKKTVWDYSFENGERVMKSMKLPNGEVVCMTTDARLVRISAEKKEISHFTVPLGARLFGGRVHMLPTGRVLVPHNAENKVVEYDTAGKSVWEVAIEQPVAAVRLPNGNTLVTTMTQNRAVEFNRAGQEVWEYKASSRVTRALRR